MISVVIPSFNGARLLPACLDALQRQQGPELEILVVDDGSRDRTAELLAGRYPGVAHLALPRRGGFAAAANRGIEAAQGAWVALLNNDAIVQPGWASALVEALEREPAAAAAAARLRRAGEPSRLDGAGDAYTRGGYPLKRGWRQLDGPDFAQPEPVFGASAAAALFRKSAVLEAGMLDRTFGSYVEDIDLAFRLQLLDYRCLYVPHAVADHAEASTSGGAMTIERARRIGGNCLRTVVKNYPGPLLRRNLARLLQHQVRLLLQLAIRARQPIGALLAPAYAARWLPRDLRERRRIQAGRRIDLDRLDRLLAWGDGELLRQRRRQRLAAIHG